MKPLFSVATCGLLLMSATSNAKGPLTADDAFRIAFGGSTVRDTELGTLVYTPGRVIDLGSSVVLISEGQNSNDCHACSGALAVHYLEERADGWYVTNEWLTATGGGTWGVASSGWGISTVLLDTPVVYSEGGGTWQGCTSSVARLLPLLPQGVGSDVVIPIFHDNGAGMGELIEAKGQIQNIQANDSFEIKYIGKKRAKAWSAVDRYLWNGTGFGLKGEPSLETC